MELYSLAANCSYGPMEQELIRDWLVVGIRNQALSKTLQLDASLTLEKAKLTIRQQESVQEQQSILNGKDAASTSVDAVSRNDRSAQCDRREQQRRSSHAPRPSGGARNSGKVETKQCTRCGKESHPRSQCPARDAICHKCSKKGQYSSQCRSKRLDESSLETAFLDSTTSSGEETAWYIDIGVGEGTVNFKLDTGGGDSSVNGNLQKTVKCPATQHASAHPLWTFREALDGSGSMQDGAGPQRGVKQPTDVCGGRIEIQSPAIKPSTWQ